MFRNLDCWFILPVLVIFSLGALTLFSIDRSFFQNQLLFFSIGVLVFLLFSLIDYQVFEKLYFHLYILAVFLLLLTFILGSLTRGSIRWIRIGNLSLQPSELVKPLLLLSFSGLALKLDFKKIKDLIIFLGLLFLPVFLIFKQPDLGSALVVFVIGLAIILSKGMRLRYLILGLLVFLASLPLGWRVLKPYQQERALSFLYPGFDPLGSGYNLIQAKIAIGSGQFLGKGLGSGTQSQLRFLPERHSDFIFACLAEEWGFLGSSLLIFAFYILILKIYLLGRESETLTGSLICVGGASLLFFQSFINIGMNLGLMPITGITLPLVSYGGSSLISTFVLLALIRSVARNRQKEKSIEIR